MFKRFIITVVVSLLSFAAIAEVLNIRKNAPQRYVVKKGDTLWDLSGIYLNEPWLWPKLWQRNPQINDPHLIYPGDIISLSYDSEGVPMLTINPKARKLSPRGRITPKGQNPIPTLPLKLISSYLGYEQALDADTIDNLPYILGADQNSKNWTIGQIIYVNSQLQPQQTYALYHKGEPYTNLNDTQPLGYQTLLLGSAKVLRPGNGSDEPAALRIVSAVAEIKAGDKLLPIDEGQTLPAFFSISRPEIPVNATIIASPAHYREFTKLDVVVLNVGLAQQVKAGNLLNIYHRSPTVIDGKGQPKYFEDASRYEKLKGAVKRYFDENNKELRLMPEEKVGELMIFKVYQNVSYALITAAIKPAKVGDTTYTSSNATQPQAADLAQWFETETTP